MLSMQRPAFITNEEITQKLTHLRTVLAAQKSRGIMLTAEGAMRWLTGIRQQIIDIEPSANSPVQALCLIGGKDIEITFITSPYEMPRIKDEFPPVFKGVKNVKIKFANDLPKTPPTTILPSAKNHALIQGQIVRPLIGGLTGNQYKKFAWVGAMMSHAVAEVAIALKPGMHGAQVRDLMSGAFVACGIESNMFLVALKGQGNHLHPLYGEQYKVAPNCWLKLVSAGRLADVIVSQTLMVKFGKVSKQEDAVYRALQEATVEYADLYRNGVNERELYSECGKRFNAIEKKYGLKGFGKSAYLHHLGGPTSPLGNRDYCLNKNSKANCFAGMSFAINPVEPIFGTKVEIQGIVSKNGAPQMLDFSPFTNKKIVTFNQVIAEGGTICKVPNYVVR